jgi:hypothetical protein
MSLVGFITGKDIARLDDVAFANVMNNFITVEAADNKVPIPDLDLTTRTNDPDKGIDGLVKWPTNASQEFFLAGENAVQYKSGKLPAKKLRTEFQKPGVQEVLRNRGGYLLLVGHDYNHYWAKQLRQELARLCRAEGLDPQKSKLLVGGNVATWVCRHFGVMIMPELGKNLVGFATIKEWRSNPALKNQWKSDQARDDIIQRVRVLLGTDGADPVVRIEGSAGAGKTRLALECISEAGIVERAVYAANGDAESVERLLAAIRMTPGLRAIAVIDECDRDRQDVVRSHAELAQGRLRLLCVGPGDILFDSSANFTSVFQLPLLSEEKVREALIAEMHGAPPDIIEAAVRLSGGYVKLAFFVSSCLLKKKDLIPTEIRKSPDIRQFLKKFMQEKSRKALQAVSLFARLGWEAEVKGEAEAVAKYLSIPLHELQEGVEALREQGVILPRGRYVYVTPELLAINSAADLWDIRGPDLINIVPELPGRGPRRELLKRLATMGPNPHVRKVVETLLGENGIFKGLEDLDDEFRSEVYCILSSAVPEIAVDVLTRTINGATRDDLLGFKVGRRNVIWAIESLLRWPESSMKAARSLRSLALAENETWGNNATGIFAEYFHVSLSRSPVPFLERLPLLDELIEAGDNVSRLLAAKALQAPLAYSETRSGGNVDHVSRVPFPSEWRPRTWGDVWDVLKASVQRLQQIASGNDEAAAEARRGVLGSVYTLAARGIPETAIEILERFTPQNDKERVRIVEACKRLQGLHRESLTPDLKQRLSAVEGRVFQATYFDRLRRWVGRRPHSDYDLEGKTGFQKADDETRNLADEAYSAGISDSELAWLASPEAQNVWPFGKRLGQLDTDTRYFSRIVDASPDDKNGVFLASCLAGVSETVGEDTREDVLDRLAASRPLLSFICTWRGDPSLRGYQRLESLVRSGPVPFEWLGLLSYGNWPEHLSANQVVNIVDLMLRGELASVLETAMEMLHRHLQRHPNDISQMEGQIWKVLEMKPPRSHSMVEWEWGQLAAVVAPLEPARMITVILRMFESDGFVPLHDDDTMNALRLATAADPTSAWDLISTTMLEGGKIGSGLIVALSQWYGELIPTDVLIAWAREHPERGPWLIARILNVQQAPLPQRARALLIAFKGNRAVQEELVANLESGSWVGPFSGFYKQKLDIVRGWSEDPEPSIRSWAKTVAKGLERQLQQQKVREEEEEI